MPYAALDDIEIYYEEHGDGTPLVLLPGGMLTIELGFAPLIPELARHRRVIAIELQGHGHTPDPPRWFTLDDLAGDVVGVLDHLGLARADVLGFSFGGLVAMQTALAHPDRVDRLVVASIHSGADGYHPEIWDPAQYATSTRMPPAEHFAAMIAAFERHGHTTFEALSAKVQPIVTAERTWTPEDLAGVRARTLVLLGDHDFVRVEHAAAMLDAIPDAVLAVVPDATHSRLMHRVGIVGPVLEDFLRR